MAEVKCPVCKCEIELGEDVGVCTDCDTPFHKECYKTGDPICPRYMCGGKEFVWGKFGEKMKIDKSPYERSPYFGSAPIERCTRCNGIVCVDSDRGCPRCDKNDLPAVRGQTLPTVGQDFLKVMEDYEYAAKGGLTNVHKELLQLRMQEKHEMTQKQRSILEKAQKMYKELTILIGFEIRAYVRKKVPEPVPMISIFLVLFNLFVMFLGLFLRDYNAMLLWFTGEQVFVIGLCCIPFSLVTLIFNFIRTENRISKERKPLVEEVKQDPLKHISDEKVTRLIEDRDYVLETYGKKFFAAKKEK